MADDLAIGAADLAFTADVYTSRTSFPPTTESSNDSTSPRVDTIAFSSNAA